MIVLASNSPRRKEILTEFGYEFNVIKSGFNESAPCCFNPVSVTVNYAKRKADDVFLKLDHTLNEDFWVIGADTVVYFNGNILGKPKNEEDAFLTLKSLSGKIHKVITGYAVISAKCRIFGYDLSTVEFNCLSDETIKRYVLTGSPLDKAGSYGLQDGFNLVRNVYGSRYNVIGLPIEKLRPILDGIK